MRGTKLILLCLFAALDSGAAVLDVLPDGTGEYANIQQALLAAGPGDSIRLGSGVFSGAGNRNLVLGGEITLFSLTGDPNDCAIDIEGQGRAFYVHSTQATSVRIEGVSLLGGDPGDLPGEFLPGYGGALAIEGLQPGGDVLVANCIIEDCNAEAGGGAFIFGAEAEFLDCVFRRNVATDGSAVYCGHCESGEGVRFLGCVFHENDYPYPEVGGYGAGIYFSHSLGEALSCTFAANRAWLGAGLLISTDSSVRVQNCIVAHSTQGEGLAVFAGEVEIAGCDIFGNAGGDWIGVIADDLGIACNFSAEPLFCDAAAGDFSLREDSPCLPENNGDCGHVGALPSGCPAPTGIALPAAVAGLRLEPCFPNPFNPVTTLRFRGDVAGRLRLSVFDLSGRLLATLIDADAPIGERSVIWRGSDDQGRPLPSGVYLIRLDAGGETQSRRAVLIR